MLKSIRRRIADGEGAAESDVRNLQGNMIDAPLDDKLTEDHSERDTMGTTLHIIHSSAAPTPQRCSRHLYSYSSLCLLHTL